MLHYECESVSIDIDLKPGVYVYQFMAATGKSYLCRMLKRLSEKGIPVDGYELVSLSS